MRYFWDYPAGMCGMCGQANREGGIMHRKCMLGMIYNQRLGETCPSPANVRGVAPKTDACDRHRYGVSVDGDERTDRAGFTSLRVGGAA